jgi:hypothetical protein
MTTTLHSFAEDAMGEQTDGRSPERPRRFTDRGARFTRRRFLGGAGIAAVAAGTGILATGCQFDDGPYQGKQIQGSDTGQSSTSGQSTPTGKSTSDKGQGSSGSQSGASS